MDVSVVFIRASDGDEESLEFSLRHSSGEVFNVACGGGGDGGGERDDSQADDNLTLT